MSRRKVLSIAEGRAPAPTAYPFVTPDLPDYLRSCDLQQVFGVKASDIGRWISEGLLPASRTEVLFRLDDVRRFAQQHYQEYDLRRVDSKAVRQLLFENLPERPRHPSGRQRKVQR